MQNQKLIFKAQVMDLIGMSFPTIWNWMRSGKFPPAREIGGKICWYEAEVVDWINSRPIKQYKPLPKRKPKKSAA